MGIKDQIDKKYRLKRPILMENFVKTINSEQGTKLLQELHKKEFEITKPEHTSFQAKKQGLSCTLYLSGKLVVQGKNAPEFIEFFLEPEILSSFEYRHPLPLDDFIPHIGIDESGKGDFFGPLCIAGVYLDGKGAEALKKAGIKDSKQITDKKIFELAAEIKKIALYHVIRINPLKYNEVYQSFKNLNRLLAWGHATTIENLVETSRCRNVIIDQFADESVVELALKRKNLKVVLTQRHRAEEDIAVAAASILAREAFLKGLEILGQELGIILPKGCSAAVKQTATQILRTLGEKQLRSVCKEHFKTLEAILLKG